MTGCSRGKTSDCRKEFRICLCVVLCCVSLASEQRSLRFDFGRSATSLMANDISRFALGCDSTHLFLLFTTSSRQIPQHDPSPPNSLLLLFLTLLSSLSLFLRSHLPLLPSSSSMFSECMNGQLSPASQPLPSPSPPP